MKQLIHRTAAIIATLCITTFFTSSLITELFLSSDDLIYLKHLIVMPGLFILVPAMALTGISGNFLAKTRKGRLVEKKMKRMRFIAANGFLILIPCAIMLDQWAGNGMMDTRFYWVQALELMAGAINIGLMSLNIRDGLKLANK